FRVIGRFFLLRVAPVVPAFGADEGTQFAFDENGFGKRPPGAAEVDGIAGGAPLDGAVSKDKAIGLVLFCRSCRNVSVSFAEDAATVEYCGGPAEDEV